MGPTSQPASRSSVQRRSPNGLIMKYRVFDTEAEAIIAEKAISDGMGYAKPGINAATGAVVPEAVTSRWAIPVQIADGRWVFASPDDTGVDASEIVFVQPEQSING